MYSVLYDGSFEGFLSAVFDVFYYKFPEPAIEREDLFKGNIYNKVHYVKTIEKHHQRVWAGLQKRLSKDGLQQFYKTFLSELPAIENTLLQYVQYAFSTEINMETDFSNGAVLTVFQTAKKVHREKHRMEAFVRFQETADGLFFSIVEPDFNVLPLIKDHFKDRYADQQWLIWDAKRRYGIYYNKNEVSVVEMNFSDKAQKGKDIHLIYDEKELLYQQLWQQYFKSVNIAARKNTKLHLQHMPMRYWKYLPEKKGGL